MIISRLCLLTLVFSFLHASCANQKIINPSPKIGFNINAIDKDGLIGPTDGKVALNYEFCIPAENQYIIEVRQIDPSVKCHKKSKGRVGCSKMEWLCIGNTEQEHARLKIHRLSELPYIERIQRTYFE